MIKMQSYYEREGETAAKGLIATQIAENQLELIKPLAYSAIALNDISGTISRAGTTFDWRQVVRSKTLATAGDVKQVEITVTWEDRWQQAQSVSLATIRTQY
ncbi:type II secretion system protein [Photobacterium lutimaris]|nr:type II secretion system protein [Photobacterium lutimaris]TDR70160.1 type II secretion system (T2SS) protein I [Photobacterium lutimaris]